MALPYIKQLLPITLFILALFFVALTLNSLRTSDEQLFIPDSPIIVTITAEKDANSAINEAVIQVGEATMAKCGWN